MKTLIISTNAIGDTYISATAISCLINHYGNIKIHLLSAYKSNLLFHEIKTHKVIYITKNYTLLKSLIEIRKTEYDLVFSFFPGIVNSFFLLFSKAKIKAGFINLIRKVDWYNKTQKIFLHGISKKNKYWYPEMNYVDRVKMVLNTVGISTEYYNKNVFANVILPFNDKVNKIVVHFRSLRKERSLNVNLLRELCESLRNKYYEEIILIGAEKDFDVTIRELALNNSYIIKADLDIKSLASLIYNARMFVGIDSFPLHIADSFNKNFVGLFSQTNPKSVLQNYSKSIKFDSDYFDSVDEQEFIIKINEYSSLFS